jgi:hypothetical protein
VKGKPTKGPARDLSGLECQTQPPQTGRQDQIPDRRTRSATKRPELIPLSLEKKAQLRFHWLAPAGSEKERAILKALEADKAFFDEYLARPVDESDTGQQLFWRAAKRSYMGHAYDVAMQRHREAHLTPDQFHVAVLLTRGYKNAEIATLLGYSEIWVKKRVADIKEAMSPWAKSREEDHITDLNDSTDAASNKVRLDIARWFLGL